MDEYNIVLPIFNLNLDYIFMYIDQYQKQKYSLENLYNIVLLNNYYFDKYTQLSNYSYVINYINNLEISNSDLSISNFNKMKNSFLKRQFKIDTNKISNTLVAKLLLDMNLENFNMDTTNYLYDMYKNISDKTYCDDIDDIDDNDDNDNIKFSKNDINHLFDNLNEEQQNILFGKLLVSEKYYYLVVNNSYILTKMKPVIHKYILLYRYLLSYTWIYLYYNELKKGRDTKVTDNFIFDIHTAALLPIFPFDHSRPKYNPYMPILVNNFDLKPLDNFCGVPEYFDLGLNNAGICNLDEFRIRLNLFCTAKINFNIFENVDFQKYKIAITGSVMAACIQKRHPLMSILKYNNIPFNEEKNLKSAYKTYSDSNTRNVDYKPENLENFAYVFINYLNEYYPDSDLDVMFIAQDDFIFIDNVHYLYNQIKANIAKFINNNKYDKKQIFIQLLLNKTNYLFVSEDFIIDNINLDIYGTNIDKLKYINENINSNIVKELFRPYYEELLDKKYNDIIKDLSQEEIEILKNKYPDIFDNTNTNFKICINKKLKKNSSIDLEFTYKYNIESNILTKNLELFSIKYDDFFATVSSFHLPCVRSYYDGLNVYLTPSCITAHLTYMNIDYKYIFGTKDPLDILNKYRLRGYGTWLNNDEKKIIFEYSQKFYFWKNLYALDNTNSNNTISKFRFFGPIELNSKFYRPRLYNIDNYLNLSYIETKNRYDNNITKLPIYKYKTLSTINIMLEKFKTLINNPYINYEKLSAIDADGNFMPVKLWIFLSIYEN